MSKPTVITTAALWQALCLWSADVIGEFARAGHAIRPGAAGENIIVTGIDWARV
jgi:MOSC domain-containing protein YiiM